MFSLIVSIIAVVLTVGLAVATIYYGGDNVGVSGSRALAEQLVNDGEHLTSAGTLYMNDHAGILPAHITDLAPYYLSSIPLPPQSAYAKTAGQASTGDWEYLANSANVILPKLSLSACNAVNNLYGLAAIPPALDTRYLIQCYGVQEPYTFYFDPPGGNILQTAQQNQAPTLTAVSPASAPVAGGTVITLTGSNLQPGASVTVGGQPATNVTVTNGTQITATIPAHAAGAVDIAISNPNGMGAKLAGGFSYVNVTYASWGGGGCSNAVVSADGFTASSTNHQCGSGSWPYLQANMSKSSGKWYFELHLDSGTAYLGADASSSHPYFGTAGVTVGVAMDVDDLMVTLYTAPDGGACSLYQAATSDTYVPNGAEIVTGPGWAFQVTANFGQKPFRCPVPAGYNPGLYQ